jgi:hypothetical protein
MHRIDGLRPELLARHAPLFCCELIGSVVESAQRLRAQISTPSG